MKHHSKQGFSLLELAIVFAIIAAIAGGIVAGRSLLVTSQLQTVMTDVDNYIKAIDNFKQAYQGLPGDLPNATTLWGTDSSGCPSGGGSSGTCNGDGDGRIGPACSSGSFSTAQRNEVFRVWQQLASAGLYPSKLTGVSASGAWGFAAGQNVPKGSMEGSAYSLMWLDDPTLCSNTWNLFSSSGAYGNSLILGAASTNGTGTSDPAMKPQEAESIDRKMDDGLPNSGKVRTFGNVASCAALSGSVYAYTLSGTSRSCSLIFLTGF